jgi:hypothetical protein
VASPRDVAALGTLTLLAPFGQVLPVPPLFRGQVVRNRAQRGRRLVSEIVVCPRAAGVGVFHSSLSVAYGVS